jgi:hypothetical protein
MPGTTVPMATLSTDDVLAPSPFSGKFAITHPMNATNTETFLDGVIAGPEHVAWGPQSAEDGKTRELWTAAENGTVYSMLFADGKVVQGSVKERVRTGPGRALGFAWDADGGMYLCHSTKVRQQR